jgi:hypothetical protein
MHAFKVPDPDMTYLQRLVSKAAHPCVLESNTDSDFLTPESQGSRSSGAARLLVFSLLELHRKTVSLKTAMRKNMACQTVPDMSDIVFLESVILDARCVN